MRCCPHRVVLRQSLATVPPHHRTARRTSRGRSRRRESAYDGCNEGPRLQTEESVARHPTCHVALREPERRRTTESPTRSTPIRLRKRRRAKPNTRTPTSRDPRSRPMSTRWNTTQSSAASDPPVRSMRRWVACSAQERHVRIRTGWRSGISGTPRWAPSRHTTSTTEQTPVRHTWPSVRCVSG